MADEDASDRPEAAAAVEPGPPLDDGQYAFDFEDLNVAETLGLSTSGSGPGLDVSALDKDLDRDLDRFARDDAIRGALSRGVDLRVYTRQVDAELRASEIVSIADYVKEADGVAQLFAQISECEEVLGTMSSMLNSFQTALGGISSEIRTLQEQSLELNTRMSNRKALSGVVTAFLSRVAVPPALVDRIMDAPVDETWMSRDLAALAEKLEFTTGRLRERAKAGAEVADDLAGVAVDFRRTPVGAEALPNLERLRLKATSRLRDVLVKAFSEMTRAKTNVGKQQEHVLLKLAPGVAFLNAYSPDVAREVRMAYTEMLKRQYADVFKKYIADLRALVPTTSKATDNLVEYSGPRAAAASTKDGGGLNPFSNADRLVVLKDADAPPVPSHLAASDKAGMTFESMWRTVQRHLMDVSAAEHSFDERFFGDAGTEVFGLTMSLAIDTMVATLEDHLAVTGDVAGLIVIVALMGLHRNFMHTRYKCDALDHYFDRTVMLIWPSIKRILESNIQAVVAAKDAVRAKLGAIDVHAHPLMRRFAELFASIHVVYRELLDFHRDGRLPSVMSTLSREVDTLLQKAAGELSSRPAKLAFMINNYSLCLQVVNDRHIHAEDAATFEKSLNHYVRLYVDSELEAHFRKLVDFVKRVEAAAAASGGITSSAGADGAPAGPPTIFDVPANILIKIELPEGVAVMRDFNVTWRNGLKSFSDNIGRFFAEPRVAVTLLKHVFEGFSFLYKRFTAILGRSLPATAPELRELVEGRLLQIEMMKYVNAANSAGATAAGY